MGRRTRYIEKLLTVLTIVLCLSDILDFVILPISAQENQRKALLSNKSNGKSYDLKKQIDLNTSQNTTRVLTLTVSNNVPSGKKYPLELVVEPRDTNGKSLGTPGEYNRLVYIPQTLSKTVIIKDLPPETEEVKVTLKRSRAFLEMIQERLDKENFNFNILADPRYTIADTQVIRLSGTQVTFCEIEPEIVKTGDKSVFDYNLKSAKANSITATGLKLDNSSPPVQITDISQILNINSRLGGAKQGKIDFTIPNDWARYDVVLFTLKSGDEEDDCLLKISSDLFFTENSQETDSIKLPFVQNGTATIPGDPVLGIISISFPFSDALTLKDFKQLLKDLKLLPEDNDSGYDLETQEATYELLKIIDNLRCENNNFADPDLKAQVTLPTFLCSASTSNYQEYISGSIQQNLPFVILIKELTNVLKPIGLQSPLVSSDLPDSILFRALANEEALLPLPPWAKAALILGGYIVSTVLNNQKTKFDYFEQIKDSTCTRVSGTIDRRFIIGKDLNNLDRKRTNTMAGISIDNSSVFKVNVTEPFPHIPQYPGVYSTCLPEGLHTITLQFNGQDTFSMSVTVSRTALPVFVEPFIGGVFRKYGKVSTINKIVESKTILRSSEGDVRSILSPTGAGAYITNLSLTPNIDATQSEIAEALRLYVPGTFEAGNPNSKGELEPERATAFLDLAIGLKAVKLDHSGVFPLQFLLPELPIFFVNPGEQSDFILIDTFGTQ